MKCQPTSDASAWQVLLDKAREAEEAYSRRRAFRPGEAGGSGLASAHRAGPCPDLRSATGQPVSCLWARLRCSQGSWLRLAGCGPKAIIHSGGPLLLCPFSLLPAIPGVPEEQKQPLTCQLQGQAETDSQEDLGRAPGTKHVSFREEEREAEKAHRVAAVLKLPKANESFSNDSRPSSRAQSSPSQASQGTPSRLPLLACDSVRLLRRRAKKSRQKEPEEMEASTSQAEASQPQESSADRAGFLPPINEETQSPQRQPPNTKAPPRRKGTPYPR